MSSDSAPAGRAQHGEEPMDALLTLFVIMLIMAMLGAGANTFGVDTRDGFTRGWDD